MNDPTSKHDQNSSGSDQPVVEDKLVLGENPAHNRHPVVRINGGEPLASRMIDPMVYEVVVEQPLRGSVTVVLRSPYMDSEIRYTTNGRNPTNKSHLYSGPLVFKVNATGGHTALKARIYDRKNSNLKGKIIRVAFRVLVPE